MSAKAMVAPPCIMWPERHSSARTLSRARTRVGRGLGDLHADQLREGLMDGRQIVVAAGTGRVGPGGGAATGSAAIGVSIWSMTCVLSGRKLPRLGRRGTAWTAALQFRCLAVHAGSGVAPSSAGRAANGPASCWNAHQPGVAGSSRSVAPSWINAFSPLARTGRLSAGLARGRAPGLRAVPAGRFWTGRSSPCSPSRRRRMAGRRDRRWPHPADLCRGSCARAGACGAHRGHHRPGDLVAGLLPASNDFSLAMLACLAVGRVFVPLDRHYPRAWLGEVMADAGLGAVIAAASATRPTRILPEGLPRIDRRRRRPTPDFAFTPAGPDAPALVIFTSGSTGKPKGIVNSQRALLRRVEQHVNAGHLDAADRYMPLSSGCTIAGIRERLSALSDRRHALSDRCAARRRPAHLRAPGRRPAPRSSMPCRRLLRTLMALAPEGPVEAARRAHRRRCGAVAAISMLLRAWLPEGCRIQLGYSSTEAPILQWFVPPEFPARRQPHSHRLSAQRRRAGDPRRGWRTGRPGRGRRTRRAQPLCRARPLARRALRPQRLPAGRNRSALRASCTPAISSRCALMAFSTSSAARTGR